MGSTASKQAAGDMVVYPATSLHSVAPITRGVRLACFFWTQSLIRDDMQVLCCTTWTMPSSV